MKKRNKVLIFLGILIIALTTYAEDTVSCTGVISNNLLAIIKDILNTIKIAVPALITFLITLDFALAVFKQDKDGLNKAKNNAIKRVIAALIVFFAPNIIILIVDFFNEESIKACLDAFDDPNISYHQSTPRPTGSYGKPAKETGCYLDVNDTSYTTFEWINEGTIITSNYKITTIRDKNKCEKIDKDHLCFKYIGGGYSFGGKNAMDRDYEYVPETTIDECKIGGRYIVNLYTTYPSGPGIEPINGQTITLNKGEKITLHVILQGAKEGKEGNDSGEDDSDVSYEAVRDYVELTWSSSNESIVTLSNPQSMQVYGYIYAIDLEPKNTGTATVTVAAPNGKTASATVIVE